jgi:hypothetical protein
MDFNVLYDAMRRDELILLEGAMCRFHKRKDGSITIHSILSYKKGMGTRIIEMLIAMKPVSIFAKCPVEFSSNMFYEKLGFLLERVEQTSKGKRINHWRRFL